jgi:phenylacetate-CoA ligase
MIRFDPARTSDSEIGEFLPLFSAFRPQAIKCFPNSLAIFTDYLRRHGLEVDGVKTIFCTGESLYDHQRAEFHDVFGGRIVERYGTKECGLVASECQAGNGLHLFAEGAYVEVVGDDGNPVPPGESGRILITDLFNDAMPLIRYEIGDRAQTMAASDEVCGCGSPLPRVARILGRDRDILFSSAGVKRPGYLFVECIARHDIDAQVQVVQGEAGSVEIRVCGYEGPLSPLEAMRREMAALIGPGFEVTIRNVAEIARDPSGKFPYVVSRFQQNRSSAEG